MRVPFGYGGKERRAIALRRSMRRSGGRGWWIVGSLWMYWWRRLFAQAGAYVIGLD